MKKVSIALAFSTLLSACTKPSATGISESTSVSAIIDVTDPLALRPEAKPILQLYDLDHHEDAAATLRIATISDLRLNPANEVLLVDGATTERDNAHDDPHFREYAIRTFYQKVRTALGNYKSYHDSAGSCPHTECYSSIAVELNVLSKSQAQKRILLVFSNLEENSQVFSCIGSKQQRFVKDHPERVAAKLDRAYPVPNCLKGIMIFFVFKPQNENEDKAFMAMIEVYKILLEHRGALIRIQANNNSYKL